MKLYALRHGETNYNALKLCNDDPSKDVHLTERGIAQAREAAEQLRDTRIDHIFVSELPRTRETADIVNAHHDAPMSADPRINDRKTGFEGRPEREFDEAMKDDPLSAKANGGESFLEERERVVAFLKDLASSPYSSVLIVTHSQILRIMRGHFENLADEEILAMERVPNCAVFAFET